jgi:hypothetical protein
MAGQRSAPSVGTSLRPGVIGASSVEPVTGIVTTVTIAVPAAERPPWAKAAAAAFIALVVCSNIAAFSWAKLLESNPEALIALSSRNRYLALALGADVSIVAYWVIGPLRIGLAFVVVHLVGRAYSTDVLTTMTKYLGVTPEALEQYDRGYAKAEWILIPFFAGSNIVAALSGIHRTPLAKVIALVSAGIVARLALIWWLAHVFDTELTSFLNWLQRYSWWAVGISVALVVLVNLRNLKRGATR